MLLCVTSATTPYTVHMQLAHCPMGSCSPILGDKACWVPKASEAGNVPRSPLSTEQDPCWLPTACGTCPSPCSS